MGVRKSKIIYILMLIIVIINFIYVINKHITISLGNIYNFIYINIIIITFLYLIYLAFENKKLEIVEDVQSVARKMNQNKKEMKQVANFLLIFLICTTILMYGTTVVDKAKSTIYKYNIQAEEVSDTDPKISSEDGLMKVDHQNLGKGEKKMTNDGIVTSYSMPVTDQVSMDNISVIRVRRVVGPRFLMFFLEVVLLIIINKKSITYEKGRQILNVTVALTSIFALLVIVHQGIELRPIVGSNSIVISITSMLDEISSILMLVSIYYILNNKILGAISVVVVASISIITSMVYTALLFYNEFFNWMYVSGEYYATVLVISLVFLVLGLHTVKAFLDLKNKNTIEKTHIIN